MKNILMWIVRASALVGVLSFVWLVYRLGER